MKRLELENKWVLVTGASSGLGREMALLLAKDYGANVVAVARRSTLLEELARDIREKTKRECVVLTADLATRDGPQHVFTEATAGREIAGVVLNAGVTFSGYAIDQEHDDFERMLATNVSSQVSLSKRFSRYFIDRKLPGAVMLVSSLAGEAPFPFQAAYSGTKAFLTRYGRGLSHELKAHGVSVTVFVPGAIATDMIAVAGMGKWKKDDFGITPTDVAARSALGGFVRRSETQVPGLLYKAALVLMKLAPHWLVGRVVAGIYNDGVKLQGTAEKLPLPERSAEGRG